jgi:hypothetical protein
MDYIDFLIKVELLCSFPMRVKLLLLAMMVLLLSSCAWLESFFALSEDWNYSFNDGGITFLSLQAICAWTARNVAYETDLEQWGATEYWASPEQTFASRKGDCEDKSILFMYFAHEAHLASDPHLVAVLMSDGSGHALVKAGDMYFDPTSGTDGAWSSLPEPVLYTLNYGETMYIATHTHEMMRGMRAPVPLGNFPR